MVTGVAGTFVDNDRNKGADGRLQEVPGHQGRRQLHRHVGLLHRAAQHGRAAPVAAEGRRHLGRRAARTASSRRSSTRSAPLPPTAGEAENGFRKFLLAGGYQGQHVKGISIGQPPFLVLAALELARASAEQASTPRRTSCSRSRSSPEKTVKNGETVFPNLPDSFFADFTDSGPNATVKICVAGGAHGQALPRDALKVNLP